MTNSRPWIYPTIVALLLGVAAVWTVYVALRLRATYELEAAQAVHDAQVHALQLEHDALKTEVSERVNELERVLFGEVLEKVAKKPAANRLEQWLLNRDKEMRARLDRLERWRLAHESR